MSGALRARAHLAVGLRPPRGDAGRGAATVRRLRSDAPLVLRPTRVAPTGGGEGLPHWDLRGPDTARVSLASGAASPVGGDQLRLDVEVGEGATLVLRGVSATLALPGPHGQASHQEVTVRVAAGGTLVWLPGSLIAARGCQHHAVTRVVMQQGARLLAREELVLGRHGEEPGAVRQRLRVTLGDAPVHDQELTLGPPAPGWEGPAVTGGRGTLGSLLLIDPEPGSAEQPGDATSLEERAGRFSAVALGEDLSVDAAVLPLGGSAALVTALAPDAVTLRRRLDAHLAALAWQDAEARPASALL